MSIKNKILKHKIILSIVFTILFFIYLIPKDLIIPKGEITLKISDRDGNVLREVYQNQTAYNVWVDYKKISPEIIKTTVFLEDKNFYKHRGIDFFGLVRALYLNALNRKVVSGGSTITQQLAKRVLSFKKRNLFHKAIEAFFALIIEAKFTKAEILELYLNRVYYGNRLYGVETASLNYFKKPTYRLTLAEAAFLTNIPKAPYFFNPYNNFKKVKKQQEKLLKKMWFKKEITFLEYQKTLKEKIALKNLENKFYAPHFCDYILSSIPIKERRNISEIRTTLYLPLQNEIEGLLKTQIKKLYKHNVNQGAVIVIDNKTSEILAMVGSVNYFNTVDGQVNGVLSLRQPGSALKPFTYALAVKLGVSPSVLISDLKFSLSGISGEFSPKNYDLTYHGPTRLRTALASSYNIPAVKILNEIKPEILLNYLHRAGFKSLKNTSNFYGVGLTLGVGEVSLLELTRAYTIFANQGKLKYEKSILNISDKRNKETFVSPTKIVQVFSPAVAYIVTNILADNGARMPAFSESSPINLPFPCAVKTGTSKNFKDNWTIGFTKNFTVGVWVGNFNGDSMYGISGITGAAPLFRDIMLLLNKKFKLGEFNEPEGIVHKKICPKSGKLLTKNCPNSIDEIFLKSSQPKEYCTVHRVADYEIYSPVYYQWMKEKDIAYPLNVSFKKSSEKELIIIFPKNGDVFKIDTNVPLKYQNIHLKAYVAEGIKKINWLVNDKELSKSSFPFTTSFNLKSGKYKFQISTTYNNFNLTSKPVFIKVLN